MHKVLSQNPNIFGWESFTNFIIIYLICLDSDSSFCILPGMTWFGLSLLMTWACEDVTSFSMFSQYTWDGVARMPETQIYGE